MLQWLFEYNNRLILSNVIEMVELVAILVKELLHFTLEKKDLLLYNQARINHNT